MTLIDEQVGNITVVTLSGQVDSVNSADLETRIMAMLDGSVKDLLLDCSNLDYINSAGLRVFLLAAKKLEQNGGILAFCSLVPNVRLVFETIGFDRILTLYSDRSTALEGMNLAASRAA